MSNLLAGQIQLHLLSLDTLPVEDALLTLEERLRADRLLDVHKQRRFRAAHTALHQILTPIWRNLTGSHGPLPLQREVHGKPTLPGRLRFNLSHSGAQGLLGVALDTEIGVDLEEIRPDLDTGVIAAHFFRPEEQSALARLPAWEQHDAFYRIWVRKEALLKASGVGLGQGLRQTPGPLVPSPLTAWTLHSPWYLRDISVPGGFMAAIAASQPAEIVGPEPFAILEPFKETSS